jgi:hypothetical protein
MEEALAEYERIYEADPSVQHATYVAVASVSAHGGDRGPAERLLKQLKATAKGEFVPAMMFAWLHLFLGNLDEAMAGLERASENREYELLVAKVAYGFDGFRAHPRFQSILDKLGLDWPTLTVNSR